MLMGIDVVMHDRLGYVVGIVIGFEYINYQ